MLLISLNGTINCKKIESMPIDRGIKSVYDCGRDKYWTTDWTDDGVRNRKFMFTPVEGMIVAAGIFGLARLDFYHVRASNVEKKLVPIMKEAITAIRGWKTLKKYTYGDIILFIDIVLLVLGKTKTKNDHTDWVSVYSGGKGEYNPSGDYIRTPLYHETFETFLYWKDARKNIKGCDSYTESKWF